MKALDEISLMWQLGQFEEAVREIAAGTPAQIALCAVRMTVEHGETAGRWLAEMLELQALGELADPIIITGEDA